MPRSPGWLGVFRNPDDATRAVTSLRGAGCKDLRAAMPAPYGNVQKALGLGPSQIGWVTFIAALTGMFAGYLFASWTSVDWPLSIGGRPKVSLLPYTVIGFECTILFGGLGNLIALLILMARSRRARSMPMRPEFSEDKVGIFVPDRSAAKGVACDNLLLQAGAIEVEHVGA